jgi:diguanylate cyclase (GGDEF)-like protein
VVAVQTFDPGLPDTAYQEKTDFHHPVAWSRLSGLVIILNAVDDAYLPAIRDEHLPTVTISQEYPALDAPVVLSDNQGGVQTAVDHLIDHGHRAIAFAGHVSQPDIRVRYRTYRETLLARGLTPDPALLYSASDNLFAGGREAGRAMIEAGLPSTAVIAATDFNAIGIMEVLTDAGRRIPEDQAIVGFDDTAESALTTPTLTTVRQPFDRMGRLAAELVLARPMANDMPRRRYLPTTFVVRESCGCPREASSPLAATRRATETPVSRSRVRELIRDSSYFKELLNAQYEVSMDLLLSHQEDPRTLNWLRGSATHAGLLGLWSPSPPNKDGPPELAVAGRYDQGRIGSTMVCQQDVPVDQFPPADLIQLLDQYPGDVVSVVPVRMRASDWGLLAVVGPIENRLSVGRATINQWAALLSVALDREAALESLRQREESLRHAALYDPLTGLPNRVLFADRVRDAIMTSRTRPGCGFAVLFLDLDGFKVVNDSLGHMVGDQLLVQVANRIAESLGPRDLAARLGGDEFALLIADLDGARTAEVATERLKATLATPFRLDDHDVVVTASIGIAQCTERYEQAQDVLRDADIAMYRAKSQSKGSYANFDVEMGEMAVIRLQTEADLRRAVEREEFELHYQPVVELATGRIASFEALIRWRHPTRGLRAPLEFIGIAEEVGLTAPIGRWTLREVCRQLREWISVVTVPPGFRIHVNVSHKQFWHTELFIDVMTRLTEFGLSADRLALEITEGVIMQQADSAGRILKQLRDAGVRLDIDDFGTGYSSLSALLQLPIDTLKIDQSFVFSVVTDERSRELVRSIARMAHNLGMQVIAEGVETHAQQALLASLGCRYGQGFLFSEPLPADKATELLAAAQPQTIRPRIATPKASRGG